MNENIKTAIFAGTAVVVMLIAFIVQPSAEVIDEADAIGQSLFEEFDPLKATTLEIVTFDEVTGDKRAFKVKQDASGWVIPTHQNYHADAEGQMSEAASALIGLNKLTLVTADKNEWPEYEVRNPNKAEQGDEGVGRLFRLTDDEGNALAELIVGRDVKDQTNQHYVRLPDDDRVYISNIDPSRLSDKFADWIEKDLLQLDTRNLAQIVLDNHSIDEANRRIVAGEKLKLTHKNTGEPTWALDGITDELKVKDDALNAMKEAIDDLKIVNVDRKPDLLVENLRKGTEFFEDLRNPANQAIWGLLNQRGFFPVGVESPDGGDPQLSIFSNEGQILVGLGDGVEYVLRFGEITEDDDGAAKAAKAKDGDASDKPGDKSAGYSRYIYVVAKVNPDLIDKPEMKPLPEWKGEGDAPTLPGAKKPAAQEPKGNEGNTGDAGDKKDVEPTKPTKAAAPVKKDTAATKDAVKKDDVKKPAAKKGDAKKDDSKKTDSKKDDAAKQAANDEAKAAKQAAKKAAEEAKKAAADEARQQWLAEAANVQRQNQSAIEDYQQKIKDAQKRVDELNARFAPWYFVIADSEYQKIHLSRKDIVEPNTAVVNQRAGEAFLAANKAKEGVTTTASGLQYNVVTKGKGKSPTKDDTVVVRYKGTLIDGTVFDETKDGGHAEFQVGGVIKGWTEALLLMKPGSKWKLFIPSGLAYGEKGSGEKIGANAMLTFEVELVEIK